MIRVPVQWGGVGPEAALHAGMRPWHGAHPTVEARTVHRRGSWAPEARHSPASFLPQFP